MVFYWLIEFSYWYTVISEVEIDMNVKKEKQTSIMTLVAEALSDLRNYGNEFVRSCGDFDKAKKTGVKQEDVADELDMKKAAYSQLENGAMPINAYHLNKICEHFKMPLGDVFAYVDHMKKARRTIPENSLDGDVSCHYRTFPLLMARESDHVVEVLQRSAEPNWIKKVLKQYEPIKRLVYQPKGQKIRDMFDRDHLPRREQMIRNQIKKAGLWMR